MVHCHEVNRKWLCKFHITNIQQRNYYVIFLDILNTLIIIQSLLSEFRKFDIMWMIWRWDFLFYNQLVEWRLTNDKLVGVTKSGTLRWRFSNKKEKRRERAQFLPLQISCQSDEPLLTKYWDWDLNWVPSLSFVITSIIIPLQLWKYRVINFDWSK